MAMRILAIETSCDETGVALLTFRESRGEVTAQILGNALLSQTKTHAFMGGVVPSLAKREHARNLIPLFIQTLTEAGAFKQKTSINIVRSAKDENFLKKLFSHEPELFEAFQNVVPKIKPIHLDAIAVTSGPGLEPALWVGINFTKALGYVWNIPVVPVNHMEGHILSAMLRESERDSVKHEVLKLKKQSSVDATRYTLHATGFPVLSLLISGGHTELVLSKKIGSYRVIGETRDDAVGEAFDKVARMLGLPYPGGPEISRLASEVRESRTKNLEFKLPRPMIQSDNLDFSFAGLKTAVLYTLKKMDQTENQKVYDISYTVKQVIAREFEDAVTDVLVSKVRRALVQTKAKTLVVGGGVIANRNIRKELSKLVHNEFPDVELFLPSNDLTTDNAVLIGLAGYFKARKRGFGKKRIVARGTWRLA